MQWSLVAVVLIVNALFGASCASAENGKGQISQACVASALTSCEYSSTKEHSIDVVDSIEVTKSLLQNMKSEITAIRQDMKAAEDNSSSVVKSLLQEMKSEIKVILQEVKRELENVADNSQSKDCAIPGGTTVTPKRKELPKNCAELKMVGAWWSGVQTVYPYFPNPKQTTVFCDQATDEGGWTVIQSRSPLPIRENFTRSWDDYVNGFGDLKGEFWLGLDNIHALTNSAQMELRVDLEDLIGQRWWAHYTTFHVGDAASKYVLRIGGYSGDAGDGMTNSNEELSLNGSKFSAYDDDFYYGNCAGLYRGGWWFNDYCSTANLNGKPVTYDQYGTEIVWKPTLGSDYSMKKVTMRLRPISLVF